MANDGSVDDAFEKVKLYFKLKMNTPEVFRFRNPHSEEITTTFQNQNFLYLPVTPQGYSVIYASLKNYSVSTFVFDSVAKAFFMTAGENVKRGLLLKQSWNEWKARGGQAISNKLIKMTQKKKMIKQN